MRVKIVDKLDEFTISMTSDGRTSDVVKKYAHDARMLLDYFGDDYLTENSAESFKAELLSRYSVSSVKSMLACSNKYLEFIEVGYRFTHRELSRPKADPYDKMLTTAEYNRLLTAAKQLNDDRLYYIIETLCSVGLQISELQYITVSAVESGQAVVESNHRKRTVFLPAKLCRHLKDYCRENGICGGAVFLSNRGNPVNRSNVYRDIKKLCSAAQIDEQKLYPENLRRLYKQTKAEMEREIVEKMGLV